MTSRPRRTALVALLVAVLAAGVSTMPAYAAPTVDRARAVRVVSGTGADTVTFQNRLNSALQAMMDTVLGPGRAVVTTTADLDLDEVETVRKTYTRDPSAGVLSERLSRRSYTGADDGTRYESTSADRVNALNSLHEARRNAPGSVRRLSIAVLVDATAANNIDLAQLRTLVSMAAGADPGRGDTIVVAALPFRADATASRTGRPEAEPADVRQSVLPAGALGLLILILALAAWRHRRCQARIEAEREHLRRVRGALQAQRPIVAEAVTVSATPGEPRPGHRELQHAIGQPPSCDPRRVARVLRGWTGSGS